MPISPVSSSSDVKPLWVFGYGSLMWRPGFAFVEKRLATVTGYHRSFCVLSVHHRGTAANPGLVLGLDQGGFCAGLAFRVAPAMQEKTITYLREREQVTNVYLETLLPATIDGLGSVEVLAYVVNQTHQQYSGALSDEAKLALIRQGVGISGRNPDYVRATYAHLQDMGIEDADIARLAAAL